MTSAARSDRLAESPIALVTAAEARLLHPRIHRDPAFHRVRRGLHADAARWRALQPWERYAARVHAYALRHRDAVFALESAAVLQHLPVFGEPREIHVLASDGGKSRRVGDVVVHSTTRMCEVVTVGGMRVTSPAQTAVDLMRVLPPAFGLAVGDAVVSPRQIGAASVSDLRARAAELARHRGSRVARMLLALVDPRAESPGESVSRAAMLWCGFAPPELQQEFLCDGFHDRVDFWWKGVRAIGESDGLDKYRAPTTDAMMDRLAAEKRREARLRRQCDAFGRWDWAAAIRVTPLERQLEAMRVPRIGPRRGALLATLGSNPRSIPAARPASRDETRVR